MNAYDSFLVKQQIAHRGLHDAESPENTISAFGKAIDNGYAMEIDLQMSSDGVVVVFHDDNLKRVTGVDSPLCEKDLAFLKTLKICDSDEKIPTFEEFLAFIDGRQPVLIEIKDHKNVGVLEQKVADMLEDYKGEFALQSFNPFIVKWFADHTPQYLRGQLSCDFANEDLAWYKKYLLKNLFFIRYNKSQFVSYDIDSIKRAQILRLKKKMPIIAWTARSQDDVDSKKPYFDNIIFEDFIPNK